MFIKKSEANKICYTTEPPFMWHKLILIPQKSKMIQCLVKMQIPSYRLVLIGILRFLILGHYILMFSSPQRVTVLTKLFSDCKYNSVVDQLA